MRKCLISWAAAAAFAMPSAHAQEGGPPPATPEGGAARPSFFSRFDADDDGKVTLAEVTADAEKLIQLGDKDEDGLLTEEEVRDGRAQQQFTTLDADEDGQVTLAELQAQPQRGGGRRGGMGGGRGGMTRDEDGDGKFSLDELTAFQRQLFEQADADQNGELDAEELANVRPQGRGRRGGGEGQPPAEGQGGGGGQGGGQGGEGRGQGGGRRGGGGEGWGRGQGGESVKPEELFARLDKDGSGGLSVAEFKELTVERQKLAEAQKVY